MKNKKWLLISVVVTLIALISFGVYYIQPEKTSGGWHGQTANEAQGLPRDRCVCWSGVGPQGHCIASKNCE